MRQHGRVGQPRVQRLSLSCRSSPRGAGGSYVPATCPYMISSSAIRLYGVSAINFPSGLSQDQTRGWVSTSRLMGAYGHRWFTREIVPLLTQMGGTKDTVFDCGSERFRRLTSCVSLFKNHILLKPHGNEFPHSAAGSLIFLSGGGRASGIQPL